MSSQVRCTQKFKDKQGRILGYELIDLESGQYDLVQANELKQAIKAGLIRVTNLTLTSDNRLVDCKEKGDRLVKATKAQQAPKAPEL